MSGCFLNVMYSAGEEFVSIHKVHSRVAKCLGKDFSAVHHWVLSGKTDFLGAPLDLVVFWHATTRQIKGGRLAFWKRWLFRKTLARSLGGLMPDAVLIDGVRAARLILPIFFAREYPKKIAVVLHGPVRLSVSDIELFKQFSSDRLTLVTVSNGIAEHFLDKYPALRGVLIGIPNASDPDEVVCGEVSRAEVRAGLGFSENDVLFGAVGRLTKEKNFVFLIHAFAGILKREPRVHLIVVGEGELRGEMEEVVESYGLGSQVHLLGFRRDVKSLYAAFDWVVCPSIYEGFSLILGESVLAGTPVLTSDLPVFREQTKDAGLYAPVSDLPAWEGLIAETFARTSEQRGTVHARQLAAFDLQGRWQNFSEAYRRCLISGG